MSYWIDQKTLKNITSLVEKSKAYFLFKIKKILSSNAQLWFFRFKIGDRTEYLFISISKNVLLFCLNNKQKALLEGNWISVALKWFRLKHKVWWKDNSMASSSFHQFSVCLKSGLSFFFLFDYSTPFLF